MRTLAACLGLLVFCSACECDARHAKKKGVDLQLAAKAPPVNVQGLHWQPIGDHISEMLDRTQCKAAWSVSHQSDWRFDQGCAQSWKSGRAKPEFTRETGQDLVRWKTRSGNVCACELMPLKGT